MSNTQNIKKLIGEPYSVELVKKFCSDSNLEYIGSDYNTETHDTTIITKYNDKNNIITIKVL